jgi:PleD family two-component response regulator
VTTRGTQQSQGGRSSPIILIVADRRQNHTGRTLKAAGYRVMTSFTPDHAVALCVNNPVDAVVLDQANFVVTDDWSVAQSLKMIKARMCVFLIVRGKIIGKDLPAGVDAIIPEGDTQRLLKTLQELL